MAASSCLPALTPLQLEFTLPYLGLDYFELCMLSLSFVHHSASMYRVPTTDQAELPQLVI